MACGFIRSGSWEPATSTVSATAFTANHPVTARACARAVVFMGKLHRFGEENSIVIDEPRKNYSRFWT